MPSKTIVIKPADRKHDLRVIGTKISVLASGADIEDMQITVQSGEEGMGPPPHFHEWDETFYVTNGEVVFSCEGQTSNCTVGTLVHIPHGSVHAFHYGKGGGGILEITGKRSNAAAMFAAVAREVPPGPPDVAKVVEVLEQNGVHVRM